MMQGVILDADSLGPHDIDITPLINSVAHCDVYNATRADAVGARIRDAQVVMTNKVVLDRALLTGAPQLRLIMVLATGTNNIDVQAAHALGITVCNVVRYGTATVAQHTLALMLALSTRLLSYVEDVKAGRWESSEFFCLLHHPIMELEHKTLGIVGLGELGQAVAHLARALGMNVLVAKRIGDTKAASINDERVAFEELLPQVDVLSLHCPLTPQTHHLINAASLARLKSGALLINTARGALVEPKALLAALKSGRLGGAAIDVLEQEPPPSDHPLIQAIQQGMPNLLVTPHCAWASREARQRLVNQAAKTIVAFGRGQPVNIVVA